MGIANLKSAERAINAKNSFKALALIKTFKALATPNCFENVETLAISPLKYTVRGIRPRVYTAPVRCATNELHTNYTLPNFYLP